MAKNDELEKLKAENESLKSNVSAYETKYQDAEVTISQLKKTIASNGAGVSHEQFDELGRQLTDANDANVLLRKQLSDETTRAQKAEKQLIDADNASKSRGEGVIGGFAIDSWCGHFPDDENVKMELYGQRIEGSHGRDSTLVVGRIAGAPVVIKLDGVVPKTSNGVTRLAASAQ